MKQQWWQLLPPVDREAAARILNQPLAGQAPSADAAARVVQNLELWVAGETELRLR